MAGVLHHPGGHEGEPSYAVVVFKAIVTVLLVAAIVAAALGGATYVVSRALVGLMS
jgi:hypothetical protein